MPDFDVLKTIPLNDGVLEHARRDYVQIAAGQTIGEALAEVRRANPTGRIVYFYAVDPDGRLVGVVSTRRLLLSPPETRVADIMDRDPFALPADATVAEACEEFILRRFLALPIVGPGRRLLGVIDVELYTDELSDLARHEEAEDLFQLIGVRMQQVRGGSLGTALAGRFPWLLCNVAGGLACAALAGLFDGVLQRVVALALFIPVVLAVSESVSIQSLTLTLQGHHGLSRRWRTRLADLRGEAAVALPLGLLCGGLVAGAAYYWYRDPRLAGVLAGGLAAGVLAGGVYGRLIPAVLGRFRSDPKVASGPIVLAATDLTALFAYFTLATLLLR